MIEPSHSPVGYVKLLRCNPGVRRLWLAQVVSELGDWLNLVALLQLVSRFSGSAEASGWVLVIQMLPWVFWSPVAGWVADRFDRRQVMIAADLLRAGIVLGFLFINRADQLWLVYVLAGLQYSLAAFFEPARQALLPTLAQGEELLSATSLMGVTWSLMLAIGGALGGVISGLWGPAATFVVDSSSFLVSAFLLWGLGAWMRGRVTATAQTSDIEASAVRFWPFLLRRPRVIAVLLVKTGLAVTGGGIWILTVVLGHRAFPIGRDGAISVGILYGAHGFGSVIGAMMTARFFRSGTTGPLRAIFWAFSLRAIFYSGLAFAPDIATASLAVIGIAACGSLLWVASTTLIQRLIPNELHGRAFSLDFSACTLALSLSIAGTAAALDRLRWSPSRASLVTAVLAAAIGALWGMAIFPWKKSEEG